jgi:nucleotide-binding universal stress UspA family protein
VNATGRATIVVGVDGSEHAERALGWAIDEAKLRGAKVHLVAAWHVPTLIYDATGFVTPLLASIDETFKEVADEVAAAAAERVRGAGLDAETSVQQGQAADVLIEAGANAELLVVGSRGHGGFAGLLLGSVSAQCAHHASCPVVIVR